MTKKVKTDYQLKVDEIKATIKTMDFDDVVRLRKNVDTIIRDVLKAKVKNQRSKINKEIEKQNKRLDGVARIEKELGL